MFQYTEKLKDLFFFDLKPEVVKNIFKVDLVKEISFPVRAKRLINDVSDARYNGGFPISYIIEGMYFIIGADPKFKYKENYISILEKNDYKIIKKIIAEEVSKNEMEDAFILLKGLAVVQPNSENYEKLLIVAHQLSQNDLSFLDEEKSVIEEAKSIPKFPLVYLYEAMIKRKEEDYELAEFAINKYVDLGGQVDEEISQFIEELNLSKDFDLGKELVLKNPSESIKILLPLLDNFKDNTSLLYNIALAYRNLKNHEKAIYYLNEVMRIDSNIVEVFNEFGLNYASLEDYKNAIPYFRKAFEATKSIEICTNLILCYYNDKNMEQAKLHLEIAKKIMPEDEVVIQLEKMLALK